MVVAIQKSRHAVLIIAAVGIFRFVSELGRKFRITGVNPRNIARQYWPITAMPHRNREGKDFQETSEVSRGGTAKTAYDAVTGGRCVALLFIYFANRERQLARSEKEIPNPAAELARRSVIISRRILNIGDRACCDSETDEPNEHLLFHKRLQHVNSFFITKSRFHFLIFCVALLDRQSLSRSADLGNKIKRIGWRRRNRGR